MCTECFLSRAEHVFFIISHECYWHPHEATVAGLHLKKRIFSAGLRGLPSRGTTGSMVNNGGY